MKKHLLATLVLGLAATSAMAQFTGEVDRSFRARYIEVETLELL